MQDERISTLYVGVDTHKETHTLVGTNLLTEELCQLTFKNDLNGFKSALDRICRTAREHKYSPVIGLEDSGGNGRALADFLVKHSLPVKTVSPVLVVKNRQYETHPEKSDPRDAWGVAKVLVQRTDKLPSYRVTDNSDLAKDLKILVKDREELVVEQTKAKNKLHWALQQSWTIEYKTAVQKDIFGKRALAFWLKYPTALDLKRTTSRTVNKPEWIKRTDAGELPQVSDIQKHQIIRLVKRLQAIKEEIGALNEKLEELVNAHAPYLKSYPGCGTVNAASFLAYINDINRFPEESKLAKYAGIAPRKQESGGKKRDRSATRGNANLRRVIKSISLAQVGRQGNQKAKAYFRMKVKQGKTRKQALKCLMRQNVKILYCVLKEQRPYY